VLVLNWRVECRSPLSPREVDDVFLALVVPTVITARGRADGQKPSSAGMPMAYERLAARVRAP